MSPAVARKELEGADKHPDQTLYSRRREESDGRYRRSAEAAGQIEQVQGLLNERQQAAGWRARLIHRQGGVKRPKRPFGAEAAREKLLREQAALGRKWNA